MPFPSGTYVNEIRRLGARIADEFDHLYAQIEGWLRKEHKDDGSHAVVTADSVQFDGGPMITGTAIGSIAKAWTALYLKTTGVSGSDQAEIRLTDPADPDNDRLRIRLYGASSSVSSAPSAPGLAVIQNDAGDVYVIGQAAITLQISPNDIVAITSTGLSLAGRLTVSGATVFGGIVSPAQITANQNNYNPASLSSASTLHLSSDAARDITGIAAQSDGFMLRLRNTGSFAITLRNASASSSAANQFVIGADTAIAADAVLNVQYASSKWRLA